MTVERKNSRRTRFREGHEGKEKNESIHRQMPFNDKQQWCINTQREGLTVTEHASLLVFCLLNLPICNPIISLLSPSSLLYDQLGSCYLLFVCFPFFFTEQQCDWSTWLECGSAGQLRRRRRSGHPLHHPSPTTSLTAWRTSSLMSSHICQVSTRLSKHNVTV